MIRRNHRTLTFLVMTALVLACAPSLIPTAVPVPTYDPNSINTVIVQTANAAATQTALIASPVFTSTVTNIPLPTVLASATPSPTATFIFILPTATVPSATPEPGSSGLEFDCQIMSKTPSDASHLSPNSSFDMVWRVANIGKKTWDENSTDYRYKSGNNLHKTSAYDLPGTIEPGGQVELRVAMKAPDSAGSYSTIWVIKTGQNEFCKMSINIQVP